MPRKSQQSPPKPQELDAETAREILRGSALEQEEEDSTLLRVQSLLIKPDTEKQRAIVDEICRLHEQQIDLLQELEATLEENPAS